MRFDLKFLQFGLQKDFNRDKSAACLQTQDRWNARIIETLLLQTHFKDASQLL